MQNNIFRRFVPIGFLPAHGAVQGMLGRIGVYHLGYLRIIVVVKCRNAGNAEIIAKGRDPCRYVQVVLVFEEGLENGVVKLISLVLHPNAAAVFAHHKGSAPVVGGVEYIDRKRHVLYTAEIVP